MYSKMFSARQHLSKRRFDGVDVFVEWHGTAEELASRLEASTDWGGPFELSQVSIRGPKSGVSSSAQEDVTNQWQCRFLYDAWDPNIDEWVAMLLRSIGETVPWLQAEKLMSFNGRPTYAPAQLRA